MYTYIYKHIHTYMYTNNLNYKKYTFIVFLQLMEIHINADKFQGTQRLISLKQKLYFCTFFL